MKKTKTLLRSLWHVLLGAIGDINDYAVERDDQGNWILSSSRVLHECQKDYNLGLRSNETEDCPNMPESIM
jgi:hypothetical protein